ncbi:MAG: tRNA dihydrouridine synthase DusB [Verrucomicrobiales bacterium]|nr:tRNA dihydrouridine synthase DusB [Verrucomicrobiales bacterium]
MLPWFQDGRFPLYLAPMAGVTDVVFRSLCKELGADVMVTEFVSAEGIIRRDDRTRKYTEFSDEQRPVGVQLFGANGQNMAEAAKKIIDWKRPDFIDINFGCPVKKVVSKNGGSSLLRDCPILAEIAGTIARAVSVPVTAKIRIGWDANSVNALEIVKTLEGEGIQAIAVHGRTRAQGYTGEADWDVIAQCAEAASVPIIGNGDLASGADVKLRRASTSVSGVMIGRAAMANPWIFREAKHYLETGEILPSVSMADRWALILRHTRLALASDRYGEEIQTMRAMRSRLMAYSRGLPEGKRLRSRFAQVSTVTELEDIATEYLAHECQAA